MHVVILRDKVRAYNLRWIVGHILKVGLCCQAWSEDLVRCCWETSFLFSFWLSGRRDGSYSTWWYIFILQVFIWHEFPFSVDLCESVMEGEGLHADDARHWSTWRRRIFTVTAQITVASILYVHVNVEPLTRFGMLLVALISRRFWAPHVN